MSMAAGLALGACAGQKAGDGPRLSAARIEHAGLAVSYMPDLDRYTYFGPVGGPNLLYSTGLSRAPAADGTYTFFGGAYTWVAPQAGNLGWKDSAGEPRPWPPDPAMDTGPGARIGLTEDSLTTLTPVSRAGLREEKVLTILDGSTAELVYTLRNTTEAPLTAGTWTNTAVRTGAVIAVRMPEEAEVRGWDDRSIELFRSIASEPSEAGWVTLDLSRASWEPGIKVYIESPLDLPKIAVWDRGYWFLRELETTDMAGLSRLREHSEGPVAVYIQPRDHIVEAELYGPLKDIPGGGSATTIERWRLIRSPAADVSLLP
jgi:hypothetical protein